METVKQPGFLLSTAALATSIGGTFYAYRKTNALQGEIDELNTHVASIARRVGELQGHDGRFKQLTEIISHLNQTVVHQNQHIQSLGADIDDLVTRMTNVEQQIQQIHQALADEDIPLPTRRSSRQRRNVNRTKTVTFHEPDHGVSRGPESIPPPITPNASSSTTAPGPLLDLTAVDPPRVDNTRRSRPRGGERQSRSRRSDNDDYGERPSERSRGRSSRQEPVQEDPEDVGNEDEDFGEDDDVDDVVNAVRSNRR